MSALVVCPGCACRVPLPPAGRAAGCPACGAALMPAGPPEPVLSLDDAEPLPKPDDGPARPAPRRRSPDSHKRPRPSPAPSGPPPFRFPARVVVDSQNQLAGPLAAALTPRGLLLEPSPGRPPLFAPVGTKAEPAGEVLVLTLPDRVLTVRLGGVFAPDRLADDTAAFLAGTRPVPARPDYGRPWWLLGIGAAVALALAAGPVALAAAADLSPWLGVLFGLVFAGLALAANAGIVLLTRLPVAAKVGLMAAVGVAGVGVFLFGATAYLAGRKHGIEHAAAKPPPADTPTTTPGEPAPPAPAPPENGPPPDPATPPTHMDLARKAGRTRLDDGPADVTALAVSPADEAVVVAYADGTTRIWHLDQPTFEPPRPGPRADGPVTRVEFGDAGRTLYLSCPTGLVVAPTGAAARALVKIPGDPVVVLAEADRERFAAVRNGRVQVRYVPAELVKDPPAARAVNGFVTTTPKDETLPLGARPDVVLPPKTTFLAWHPSGKLLAGTPDGAVTALPTGGPLTPAASREHKAAVRAWAAGPVGSEFATGDEVGFVGYWPKDAAGAVKFRVGTAAVTHLSFGPERGEVAVASADGRVGVWDAAGGERLFGVKRPGPVKALALGPKDLLLVADGKGVEVLRVDRPKEDDG